MTDRLDPTDEQRAAVEWLRTWSKPGSPVPAVAHAAVLLDMLPDSLTNPQPALPTEPGVYSLPAKDQTHLGKWHTDGIELHYLNADGNWSDVGWGNAQENEKRPFTRLVPERPQVTREQVEEVAFRYAENKFTYEAFVDQILTLVNGTPDE